MGNNHVTWIACLVLMLLFVAVDRAHAQGCLNDHTSCTSWARAGYCASSEYVKKNCKKSCQLCPASSCNDLSTSCHSWASAGYCWNNDYVKVNCKKSCGLCTDGQLTTSAPPTLPMTTLPRPTPVAGSCGVSSIMSGRVISGQTATPGAWPWQVLMLYGGMTSCGGSLITPEWIVTAAHCVSGREHYPSNFIIRAGEHNTIRKDGTEQDIRAQLVITHPRYYRSTLDSDIALIKVSRPFQLNKRVGTVCMPDKSKDVPAGTECYITGWGKTRHPGSMHHTLQQGKIPVVSQKSCQSLNEWNFRIPITSRMVCAGHGGSTEVTGCHGDSGGPFVCQTGNKGAWELHGAVSWGSPTCTASHAYTVFARVTAFRDWIDSTMAKNQDARAV